MKVRVFTLKDGKDSVAGEIRLERGALVCDPADSQLLRNMLSEPIRDHETGQPVYPDVAPRRFLRELRWTYHGAYLRAGEVES